MTRHQPSIRARRGIRAAGAAGTLLVVGVLISGCGSSGSSTPTATTPAGKFLYGANRGNDNIVICSIDPSTFQLTVLGWVPTQGETPRHFNFDPSGNFIHVGNQNSANIVTFKVDKTSGMLTPAGLYASTVQPSCIQFA